MGSSRPRHSTRPGKARTSKPSPKPRRKPAPPKRPKLRPIAGALAAELLRIRDALELISSCAIVVQHALVEQNCLLDGDAASVLKRYVGDEVTEQIERINCFLGTPHDEGEDAEDRP